MSFWVAFLMVPGHGPGPSNVWSRWIWFGLLALSVLQAVLLGELLSD